MVVFTGRLHPARGYFCLAEFFIRQSPDLFGAYELATNMLPGKICRIMIECSETL